ncbi:helix-turn-helix transcriptional regulator [Pontibacterium granulatum]|uniref:helix-turn-helix domain-containing protein n=1 Tax=Pontibacterium granulatum TaxID=2036029 RepID=UPI00249A8A8D|nr:helix-turn-helix transcriptional regulator [Pontibacterium granulatum]MDI3324640.1 helix-turn-helix transcriptional regulator [Pontibacterium granulatum]
MESQRERSSLFSTLKQVLKTQGIQYKELAEMIGMSEPTVKRLFQEQDCKLSRLLEICDKIGLSFSQLVEINGSNPPPPTLLPLETEQKIAAEPGLFAFFILLINHFEVDQIAHQNNLDEVDCYQYLRVLEQLDLIRLGRGNTVHFLTPRPIRWRLDGPLHQMLVTVNREFIATSMENHHKQGHSFYSTSRMLSEPSIKQLQDDIDALYQNFHKQATLDQMHYVPDQLQPYKLVLAASPFALNRYFAVPKFSVRSGQRSRAGSDGGAVLRQFGDLRDR